MKIDKNSKKAIIKNRVKLLTLDYFDVTGPLLATEVLTLKKHKEIKTEATTNKARVDLLLEWLDESAPDKAFPAFLQGIRNCDEFVLAKKIKKEAASGGLPAVKLPGTIAAAGSLIVGSATTAQPDKPKSKPKTPKDVKKDTKDLLNDTLAGVAASSNPYNGLSFGDLLTPLPGISATTPASRKRKSTSATDKPKGKKASGTPKVGDASDIKVVAPGSLKVPGQPAIAPKKASKLSPNKKSVALPVTPRTTRKSSSSEKGEDNLGKKAAKGKVVKQKDSQASTESAAAAKLKAGGKSAIVKFMSFKNVEEKQKDCRQKFKFRNSNAVTKSVVFKDKTDISYFACPFEENKKLCDKKVDLKNKEYVCESRHKSASHNTVLRLNITCNDGTSDMQFILLKKDVESFCGKTVPEVAQLSVNEIKEALDTCVGKRLNMEVSCEKSKKGSKKGGVPKWDNIATILPTDLSINGDLPSPAKKKRKN